MISDTATYIGIGIVIGLTIGFILGIYTALSHRDKDPKIIAQKTVAVVVGTTWLVLHAYLIMTGAGTINVFFDAIGSAAVGELLGINLVQIIRTARTGGKS